MLPGTINKITNRTFFIALLLMGFFAFINDAQAQEKEKRGKIYGGLGYFSPGYNWLDLAPLNTELANANFSTLPNEYFSLGGGGHAIIGNIIIGGEGQSMRTKTAATERNNGNVETSMEGGYGFFNLGYVIFARKAFLLYPMVGIGGGNLRLRLSDAPQSTSFQDIVQNHNRTVDIETGGTLLNFQLGADFLLGGSGDSRGGLLLGIHGGYILAPASWDWRWQEATIANAPEVNLNGAYVRLTLGGGGFSRVKLK